MRALLVGLGRVSNAWIKALLDAPEFDFAGFVEPHAETARDRIRLHGLDSRLLFPSLKTALAMGEIDCLINLTPPAAHREVSIAALEAGVPVLSEKPLAGDMVDGQAIVKVAEETGVLLMVAQNYRYKVPVQTVKKLLIHGGLGRVGSVTVEFYKGPHLASFHDKLAYPLLIDMSIHHFDLMRYLLESEPVSVYGASWSPAWNWFRRDVSTSAIFEFSAGEVVTYCGSWCSTGMETSWTGNWRFECEKGVILLRNDRVYLQRRTDQIGEPQGYRQFLNEAQVRVRPVRMARENQAYLLKEFHLALTQGKTPLTTGQDNLRSLNMVFRTIHSIETGTKITFAGS